VETSDPMRKIINSTYISLDGVIEEPHLWPSTGSSEGRGDAIQTELLLACDALIMGRRTYEGFAPVWPTRSGDPASDHINAMPKYVVSSTLRDPEWNNTTVLSGDLADEVSKVRESTSGDVYVHGSAQLAQALLEQDLVDELHLMVFPVVLGTGRRFFGETTAKKPLQLVDSKVVGAGVAILVYRPAGEEPA